MKSRLRSERRAELKAINRADSAAARSLVAARSAGGYVTGGQNVAQLSGFSPRDIPGLGLWIDANNPNCIDQNTANNAPIAIVRDLSGNNRHGRAPSILAVDQPLFKRRVAALNNRNAFWGDGVGNKYFKHDNTFGTFLDTGGAAMTASYDAMVVLPFTDGTVGVSSRLGCVAQYLVRWGEGSPGRWAVTHPAADFGISTQQAPHIFEIEADVSGNQLLLHTDGAQTTIAGGVATSTNNQITETGPGSNAGNFWVGGNLHFAERIVVVGQITAQNRGLIRSYLAAKYGIFVG